MNDGKQLVLMNYFAKDELERWKGLHSGSDPIDFFHRGETTWLLVPSVAGGGYRAAFQAFLCARLCGCLILVTLEAGDNPDENLEERIRAAVRLAADLLWDRLGEALRGCPGYTRDGNVFPAPDVTV